MQESVPLELLHMHVHRLLCQDPLDPQPSERSHCFWF